MTNPFYALLFVHEEGIWTRREVFTWRISFYNGDKAGDPYARAEGGPHATAIEARAAMSKVLQKAGYGVVLTATKVVKDERYRPPKDYAIRFAPRNVRDYLPWVVVRQWPRRAGRVTIARCHKLYQAMAVVREDYAEKLRRGYGGAPRP
jgi:hypothetical protein